MANIFPRWTNWLPIKLLVCVAVVAASIVSGMAYYFTPKYTRVGYQPTQPVEFDHSLHVNQLGMDCRYCHTQIKAQSPKLEPVRQ
ncbi:MAG: cytochrome C, partial [Verrucomicrobia bacterium]|nr:cytochrome C [Verrucomicrobiota bacterium]